VENGRKFQILILLGTNDEFLCRFPDNFEKVSGHRIYSQVR